IFCAFCEKVEGGTKVFAPAPAGLTILPAYGIIWKSLYKNKTAAKAAKAPAPQGAEQPPQRKGKPRRAFPPKGGKSPAGKAERKFMLRIFKTLHWKEWLYAALSVGFIVLQVWLDLTMPDYMSRITLAITGGTPDMAEVWKDGGLMLA